MTISSFSAENSLETAEFLLKHEIKCVSLIQKLKDSPSEVFIFRNTKTNAIAGIISVSAGGSILHCLPDLQVIVAAEKAGIAMQVTLQVRNKIVEAYQEVMRMQV